MTMSNSAVGYAVGAGLCAAVASVCAKLAMASEVVLHLCNNATSGMDLPVAWQCDRVVLYLRMVLFGMIFLFNGIMWTLFVKSLQYNPSSLQPTVTNTAANFCFTAFFGLLLFGETVSLMWYVGASIIIVGLILVNQGTKDISEEDSPNSEEDSPKYEQSEQENKKTR